MAPRRENPHFNGSWGRWELMIATSALMADGSEPNLSDGRLYEPGGAERVT
jgi:hypothetical protein